MKQLSIIGTIHAGVTPIPELKEELHKLKPDKVLVELTPNETRYTSVRDEMFATHDWAQEKNIALDTFDTPLNTLREGITGEEEEFRALEGRFKEILKDYTWKDLNKLHLQGNDPTSNLEIEILQKYIDPDKDKKREYTMLQNIRDKQSDGHTVVVTGTAHLTFFKNHLPDAVFPLAAKKHE